MGYFDLPTGELELLMKKKGRGGYKPEWKLIAFTDRISDAELASDVERWSKNYKVIAARHNGREVEIPTAYHWELRNKDEVYGCFKTWEDAKVEMINRKCADGRKCGSIWFVKE